MKESLRGWLQGLGMGEYLAAFENEGYDMETLVRAKIKEEDLVELGVARAGHRKKILLSLQDLGQASGTKAKTGGSKGAWKTATDPRGRVYYYNTKTRETRWTAPEEEVATAPKKKGGSNKVAKAAKPVISVEPSDAAMAVAPRTPMDVVDKPSKHTKEVMIVHLLKTKGVTDGTSGYMTVSLVEKKKTRSLGRTNMAMAGGSHVWNHAFVFDVTAQKLSLQFEFSSGKSVLGVADFVLPKKWRDYVVENPNVQTGMWVKLVATKASESPEPIWLSVSMRVIPYMEGDDQNVWESLLFQERVRAKSMGRAAGSKAVAKTDSSTMRGRTSTNDAQGRAASLAVASAASFPPMGAVDRAVMQQSVDDVLDDLQDADAEQLEQAPPAPITPRVPSSPRKPPISPPSPRTPSMAPPPPEEDLLLPPPLDMPPPPAPAPEVDNNRIRDEHVPGGATRDEIAQQLERYFARVLKPGDWWKCHVIEQIHRGYNDEWASLYHVKVTWESYVQGRSKTGTELFSLGRYRASNEIKLIGKGHVDFG